MARSQDYYIKIIVALTISSVLLAALCFSKQAQATNKVVAIGEIKLYHEDGSTQMTSYNFPLFTGGTPGTYAKWFVVRNTGKQPVHISWSLTASSIAWSRITRHNSKGYDHNEGGIKKYTFRILQDTRKPDAYIPPEQKTILLKGGDSKKLCFELSYSGKPNTAEKFTLTVSFYATKPENEGNACNSKYPTLNPRSLEAKANR